MTAFPAILLALLAALAAPAHGAVAVLPGGAASATAGGAQVHALLRCDGGRQRMVLGALLPIGAAGGLWVLPVPGATVSARAVARVPWVVGGAVPVADAGCLRVAESLGIASVACLPGQPLPLLLGAIAIPSMVESRSPRTPFPRPAESAAVEVFAAPAASAALAALTAAGSGAVDPVLLAPWLDGRHSLVLVRLPPLPAGQPAGEVTARPVALALDLPADRPWLPLACLPQGARLHALVPDWWQAGSGGPRADPALGLRWSGSHADDQESLAFLGFDPARPPERMTLVVGGPSAATALAAGPGPGTAGGAAVLAIGHPPWLLLWLTLLAGSGAASGWMSARLLGLAPSWGARSGLALAGSALAVWWLARREAARQIHPPDVRPTWPRGHLLRRSGMLASAALALPYGLALGLCGSVMGMPASLIVAAAAMAALWLLWGRWKRVEADHAALARYGAWAAMTPLLAIAMLAIALWPLLAWTGRAATPA